MRKKLIVALLACLLVVGLTLPAGAASVEGPVMGDAALTDGAVTVSYTHLDVYKRQVCIHYNTCSLHIR